jgi:hypothetical protein
VRQEIISHSHAIKLKLLSASFGTSEAVGETRIDPWQADPTP